MKVAASGKPRVTISIGVAEAQAQMPQEGPEEVIRRADGALYRAKETGRNRVVNAGDLAPA